MKIKRYTGASTREVLARIRGDLGPDAVILSNREIAGGVELMAAVDFDASRLQAETVAAPAAAGAPASAPSAVAPPAVAASAVALSPAALAGGRVASRPKVLPPAAGKSSPRQPTVAAAAVPPARAAAADGPVWAGEIRNLRDELEALREWVHASVARAPVGSASAIELRLQALGLDAEAARQAAAGAPDADGALDAWLARLPLHEQPMEQPGVYALLGATGVGKTTTIAKLAARLVLRHGTQAVALVTTDTYRIGGVEQLRIYGRILGVPVAVAHDSAELREQLQAFAARSFVLVDTIGLSPRDPRLDEQLQGLRALAASVRPLLLLGAGMSLAVYQQAGQLHHGLSLAGCILTKLDETPLFGGALQWLQQQAVPLWFYTDGQRVPEDLHAPTLAKIKALLQRGSATTPGAGEPARPGRGDADPAVANSR